MNIKMFTMFCLAFFLNGCRKEVVSVNLFEQSILENSIYSDIPQLQSNKESILLKANAVRAMSYVKEYTDSNRIDSLTYLRFDKEGKIIQRTTNEVTSVGCLQNTIIQIFRYNNDKVKRVENYIFKYKLESVFEKWMETDTSNMKMFDWEDYSYNGDTVFVESGSAAWKFVKDDKGNLQRSFLTIKGNNQIADVRFISTPFGVKLQIKNDINEAAPEDYEEYEVELNKVTFKPLMANALIHIDNIYDEKGFLKEKIHYKNDRIIARTRINYYYYEQDIK